jgi:hypothetical protein
VFVIFCVHFFSQNCLPSEEGVFAQAPSVIAGSFLPALSVLLLSPLVNFFQCPVPGMVEQFALLVQPELDKKLLAEIRACRFVEEHKNIILIEKPGTGKTHLANAIGLEAAAKGYSVVFSHLHTLLEKLAQGRADNSHRRIIQHILAPACSSSMKSGSGY